MLDTLSYSKNQNGSYTKTVTSVSILDASDVDHEIQVLQDMVINFQAGDQNSEILSAIENYQQQISILQVE